mmetsp:Transcript_5163/g.16308  ORF Transcript_5163/g.16308 Transcript_5163/m.16308 type:complete len:220 (+) Transcript_5163:1321-1980(+)
MMTSCSRTTRSAELVARTCDSSACSASTSPSRRAAVCSASSHFKREAASCFLQSRKRSATWELRSFSRSSSDFSERNFCSDRRDSAPSRSRRAEISFDSSSCSIRPWTSRRCASDGNSSAPSPSRTMRGVSVDAPSWNFGASLMGSVMSWRFSCFFCSSEILRSAPATSSCSSSLDFGRKRFGPPKVRRMTSSSTWSADITFSIRASFKTSTASSCSRS